MEEDKEEYKRFTVSLSKKLYENFESFREKRKWARSDSIRKAMNSFMISEENIPISSGNVVGCITMIMSHEHVKKVDEVRKILNSEINTKHNHDHDYQHAHEYISQPIYANIQQTDSILSKDIQHHYGDVILSNLHIHLKFEKCMEIIAVSGPYDRIKELRDNLQRLKSVLSIGFFVVDREDK
ncbi:MAG: CopG family ribbon-helix-helix protein [Candidatus Thorarchaeota archaeon]